MPLTDAGLYKKDTKLIVNPKYNKDIDLQRYWGIELDEVYKVVKHFYHNGEYHVMCQDSRHYPDFLFIEKQ